MSLKTRYLKHDSDGSGNFSALKEMSDTEFMRVARITGEKFALHYDSTNEGNIREVASNTTNADSIGAFIDTHYSDADGTDIDVATLVTNYQRFAIQNTTFGDASSNVVLKTKGTGFVGQKPLVVDKTVSSPVLKARSFTSNDSTNETLDDIIVKIFSNDLPGCYHMDDSSALRTLGVYNSTKGKHYPDSDNWDVLYTLSEIRNATAGEFFRQYNIYQKTSLVAGSATSEIAGLGNRVNPIAAQVGGDDLLTNLKAMKESDLGDIVSSALCQRIADNQLNDRVGKLVISPTDPGANYRALGQGFDDKRRGTTLTGDGTFVGTFTRVTRTANFTRNFTGTFNRSVYSFTRNFTGTFTRNFTTDFTSNFVNPGFQALDNAATKVQVNTFKLYVKIS